MVVWIGPLSSDMGYAEEGRAFVDVFDNGLGCRTLAIDVAVPERADQIFALPRLDLHGAETDSLHIYHRYWPAEPSDPSAVNVWRTMFETAGSPLEFVECAQLYDYIWVPSAFNYDTFRLSGVPAGKLRIVHSPNPTWSSELIGSIGRVAADDGPSSDSRPFRFVSVMRWQRRKGWDILLDAFKEAAENSQESFELVVRATPFDVRDPEQIVRDTHGRTTWQHNNSHIRIITRRMPRTELIDLYASGDCFVLPSRGEGWGRPYVEAMLAGLPVICPDWSGCTEFISRQNSFLYSGNLSPVGREAEAEWSYYHEQSWLEPDVNDVVRAMSDAIRAGRPSVEKKSQVSRDIARRFGRAAIAAQVREVLASDGIDYLGSSGLR